MSKRYNVEICYTKAQRECENENRVMSNTLEISTDHCPLECLKTEYNTNINTGDYPSDSYCQLLATQHNALEKFELPPDSNSTLIISFVDSFMMVSIYFEDASYTYIETSLQVPPHTLIGLIGKKFNLVI